MRISAILLVSAAVVGSSSKLTVDCGGSRPDNVGAGGDSGSNAPCVLDQVITYSENIRPIFATHCLRCHHSNLVGDEARNEAPAEVNFDTYASTTTIFYDEVTVAEHALFMVEEDLMPADSLTDPSDAEIACIAAWIDQGMLP